MSLKVWPKWPDGGGSGDEEYLIARMIFGANIHPLDAASDSGQQEQEARYHLGSGHGNKHKTCIFQIFISQDPILNSATATSLPLPLPMLLAVDWN